MRTAIIISARDNVATALRALEPGLLVDLGGGPLEVTEMIPSGHKIALRPIHAGEPIVKYGSPIGTASSAIAAGAHVHTHNVASARGRGDLADTMSRFVNERPERSASRLRPGYGAQGE